MALEQTWRWFGPDDPVTLKEIRQTGATGVVTALHQIPVGEIWPVEEVRRRKESIESEGLSWSVAESLPVHEDIKIRQGNFRQFTENYKDSIRNLGACGIDTVCYNFMPVLDWSRTDLSVAFHDGSMTTRFEAKVFAAFDLFILKRPRAESEYSEDDLRRAKEYFDTLDKEKRKNLEQTVLLGFPGSGDAYTLEGLRRALSTYDDVGEQAIREHLQLFLMEIIPVAEESGVLMTIHPDDPPRPLLGLPRIMSSERDIEQVLSAVDSPSNGITLCTGSLGAHPDNDLVRMTERFASRINFVHLRNVTRTSDGGFIEDNHLDGDVDLYGVMKELLVEQKRREDEGRNDRRMPFRPDHGHLMSAERNKQGIYPGYSLFGRMRGLAELRGMELGIRRSLGL
jgi:mannonate dehydratase